jgi:hypothetical protein
MAAVVGAATVPNAMTMISGLGRDGMTMVPVLGLVLDPVELLYPPTTLANVVAVPETSKTLSVRWFTPPVAPKVPVVV